MSDACWRSYLQTRIVDLDLRTIRQKFSPAVIYLASKLVQEQSADFLDKVLILVALLANSKQYRTISIRFFSKATKMARSMSMEDVRIFERSCRCLFTHFQLKVTEKGVRREQHARAQKLQSIPSGSRL